MDQIDDGAVDRMASMVERINSLLPRYVNSRGSARKPSDEALVPAATS